MNRGTRNEDPKVRESWQDRGAQRPQCPRDGDHVRCGVQNGGMGCCAHGLQGSLADHLHGKGSAVLRWHPHAVGLRASQAACENPRLLPRLTFSQCHAMGRSPHKEPENGPSIPEAGWLRATHPAFLSRPDRVSRPDKAVHC